MRSGVRDPIEASWIREASRGDADAFAELYRRYLGDVRDFCARRIGDPIRAEDLAQETFLRAFQRIDSFRERAAFWPWVSTIARNLCIDELRLRGRVRDGAREGEPVEETLQSDQLDPTFDQAMAEQTQSHVGAAVRAAMQRLPERDRRLVWNHAVEKLSWSEIASRNRTTLHAARNAAWRARMLLRSMLADSLRDLRAWVAVVIGSMLATRRRLADRVRARTDPAWTAIGQTFVLRVADVVLAAALVSAGYLSGSPATSFTASGAAIFSSPASSTYSLTTGVANDLNAGQTQSRPLGGSPVKATVTTAKRPRGAAPSAAHLLIEVRSPNGELLYADETTMSCGDGRTIHYLPSGSPIQAYC